MASSKTQPMTAAIDLLLLNITEAFSPSLLANPCALDFCGFLQFLHSNVAPLISDWGKGIAPSFFANTPVKILAEPSTS